MVDRLLTTTLNKLIRLFKDAEKAYARAIDLVQDETLKTEFSALSQKRQEFADEIQTLMSVLGEDYATEGTTDMSLEIMLNEMQLPFSSDRDQFILNAISDGIKNSVDDFEDALEYDLPLPVREILQAQLEVYRADCERLQELTQL